MNEIVSELSEAEACDRIERLVDTFLAADTRDLSMPAPQAGSSLAKDDTEFPLLATSHAVQSGVMAAREHLRVAGLLWRSHPGRILVPSAYSTLVRAAMVGAGTALWILYPAERSERVRRTAMFAIENFRNELTVQREALEQGPALGIDARVLTAQENSVARAADHLNAARTALWSAMGCEGEPVEKSMKKYRQTAALADAAAYLYRENPKLEIFSQFLWRTASGDAHGLIWPKLIRAKATGEYSRARQLAGPVVELRDVNNSRTLFPLLAQGKLLWERAEKLYEMRRVVHPAH